MVCEPPSRQKSLTINKRGKFFGDPFFRDSWADYNSAVRRIVDRFNDGWIRPSERIRDSQYHSMYRTLRSARQNYSTHSARFREEADCYKLIMDVHEFVGGDITVRTAGKTVSVRGKVEAGADGIPTLRTEKAKQYEDSDTASTTSGKSTSSRTLHRRYTLPTEADCDKIESALSKDAVLTVTIPKRTDIRFIPLTIDGREYKSDLTKKRNQDERNGGIKRPNDSPLLSSRKKSQEEHESKGSAPPWARHRTDRDENKENSYANAESVSARRSRFEKFLNKNSFDEAKEGKESSELNNRVRDKYEEAREVIIPITFSDQSQDKVYSFTRDKVKCEAEPVSAPLSTWKAEKSRDQVKPNSSHHFLPGRQDKSQIKDYGKSQTENKQHNGKKYLFKDKLPDETVQPKLNTENSTIKSPFDRNNEVELKIVENEDAEEIKPWQRNQPNKRERSIDDIISSLHADKTNENIKNKEINSKSTKSAKLDHQTIPRLNLCKPQISEDSPPIVINQEDNLKTEISKKLDTLDTPKTKEQNRSPSVTPGGREILIQKRQSLMEDDMFQDCWSDFSNTLQEVLNRLQELSSELGQSKLLTNSLTESQNEEQPTVPGNHECLDSEMEKSSSDAKDEEQSIKSEGDRGNKETHEELVENREELHSVAQLPKSTSVPGGFSTRRVNNEQSGKEEYSLKNISSSLADKYKNPENFPESLPTVNELGTISYQQDFPPENSFGAASNCVSEGSFIDTIAAGPVLESKLAVRPVQFDTESSVRVNVLQPQTSVDLVSLKDLSSKAVSQSSSVCLTDSNSTGDIPPVRRNQLNSRINTNQNTSKFSTIDTVPKSVINSDDINSCNVDNRSNTSGHNAADDTSGTNNSSRDSLNDFSSYSKYFDKTKQRTSDADNDYDFTDAHKSAVYDFKTISRDKDRVIAESLISAGNKEASEVRASFPHRVISSSDYIRPDDIDSSTKDANESHDCEEIVDILNGDVMRRSAFSQNGANSPRYKASHLSSAKSSARRVDDQKEKKTRTSQEHCNANFADAHDMGSLLTRGKDTQRGNNSQPTSSVNTPLLNENTNPLRYASRNESVDEVPPVPSYVRQTSQPSRRFTGFGHVNSNNVRRISNTWSTKPDKEDSEPTTPRNRTSPSPTRSASSRTCSPSPDIKARCRSPSPMRCPTSPKDESYSSFRRTFPSRPRQSFSPNRASTDCPMNPRDSYKRSAQKSSYSSPTFSSSQKTCAAANGKKTNGSYKCSSQDAKQFNRHFKNSDSPVNSPKIDRKENSEGFNSFKLGSVPERKRPSDNSSFKPKYEPSYSPKTHHRIFKRFRNANLQPDSETICFKEEENRYKMVLDVEEFVPGEIEVLQDDGVLTVKGKVETRDGPHVSVRTFNRTFDIPKNSREEDIDSALSEDGILTIFVPKKRERIIKIELVD